MYSGEHLADAVFDLEVIDGPEPAGGSDSGVITLGDPEVIRPREPTEQPCAKCMAGDLATWRSWHAAKPFYLLTARWRFARILLRLISLTMFALGVLILIGRATPGDAKEIIIALGGLLLAAQPVLLVCLADSGLKPIVPDHHPACPQADEPPCIGNDLP